MLLRRHKDRNDKQVKPVEKPVIEKPVEKPAKTTKKK